MDEIVERYAADIDRWEKLKQRPESIELGESLTGILFRAADASIAFLRAYRKERLDQASQE